MWYPVEVAAPATEPVTVATAKQHCRVDIADDDVLFAFYVAAARDLVERACNVRFAQRTGVALKCDGFADLAVLPEAPVSAVAITYVDTTGTTQTLAGTVYELRNDDLSPSIVLKYGQTWPAIQTGSRITVTATIGYSTPSPAVRAAMLLAIGHHYENRESVVVGQPVAELPMGFYDLIANDRRHGTA